MSDLNSLKQKPRAKRILKGINFDHISAEVSYTDQGAASLKDQPYLLKSQEFDENLTENQKQLLEAFSEEAKPLTKALGTNQPSPSVTESVAEGTLDDKGDIDMSEELVKELQGEIAALRKERAEEKAVLAVSKYGFEVEQGVELAKELSVLGEEVQAVLLKGFDALVAKGEAAVEAELEKATKEDKEENPLAKAMAEEEGHEEVQAPTSLKKSMAEQLIELQNKEG